MKSIKRNPRNSKVPESRFVEPIDPLKFGSADDPCFGKLYDLTTPECKSCGDIELCAIAKSQGLRLQRLNMEKLQAFKDLTMQPDEKEDALRKWLLENKETKKRGTLILEAKQKFNKTRAEIKQLLSTL